MSNFYVDSNTGSNSDNGTTQALAWATLEHALEAGSLNASDIVWIRRTHVEYSSDPTSDIAPIYDGTRLNPIKIIGWPRAVLLNTTITSASWTNGSTTVDLVVGVTLSRGAHQGRFATAPNGKKFLITRIIDSNTLIIDREYSGTTVTLTNGKFQVEADEDYSDRPADVDGWDSDADAIPCIDFRNVAYSLYFSGDDWYQLSNIEFRDSTDIQGIVISGSKPLIIIGCLFYSDQNARMLSAPAGAIIDRCIFEGTAAGTSNQGIGSYCTTVYIKNSAIYGCGRGINIKESPIFLDNVNLGVEVVNTIDIHIRGDGNISGKDIKLGGTTKVSYNTALSMSYLNFGKVSIENYQKVLGKHTTFTASQTIESLDVVAGSGDPYKRTGGADKLIQIDCSISSSLSPGNKYNNIEVFCHEFEVDTTSKSYRYYVQCKDLSLTASELWLEVEYVDSYDDTSEYTITKEESDEACTIRSGVSDWTQYIEVTGIQPAVASKVRIKCFVAKYDADGLIFIDPAVSTT